MCEDIKSPLLEVLGMICSFLPVYDVAALEMVSCPFALLTKMEIFFALSKAAPSFLIQACSTLYEKLNRASVWRKKVFFPRDFART